jgi:hypothetical protein
MAEETTQQFLARRERELIAQISALRGQLAPKEAELAQIQRMKASLTLAGGNSAASAKALANVIGDSMDTNALNALAALGPPPSVLSPSVLSQCHNPLLQVIAPYPDKTIKELVVQALLDHFPDGGTAADIRNFIRDAYGRTIEPSSLRPQMHRLKTDEILRHEPSTDTWNFRDGKRALYARYDHPTSRKAMRELQDEPVKPRDDKS